MKQSIKASADTGKSIAINTCNLEQAQDYLDAGANFVLVGADVQQLNSAARGLVEKFITPLKEGK
ncbi:hypothetical protein [Corynebacterium lubricantis]|uniref:hypothetical protein n=1 Tax=Corynebacterium lubricantis TaxID=541095 RepID=UPI00036FD4CB|nr:hypothetical protein [Corynebacterium lubricantis]